MVIGCEAIRATEPLSRSAYDSVVRRTVFDCCKWDPQFEDISVLAPFALILSRDAWSELRELAESLAAETVAIEKELLTRPDLHRDLALSRNITRILRSVDQPNPEIARVMRFDFHPTSDGWLVSEVNCDVPGGYIEGSGFTSLMAEHWTDATPAGDPATALVDALAARIPGAAVALVHATAYTDDRQVMVFLARRLAKAGLRPCLASPDQVVWRNGRASVGSMGTIDAIMRFFPAEWLCNLRRQTRWEHFFRDSVTPHCNPATALLMQSKRVPLVWDQLGVPVPTWRRLLPTTCEPRAIRWPIDEEWIVKPALGRVGESIGMAGVTDSTSWKPILRSLRWSTKHWIAQRKFDAVPVETCDGPRFPCIGVYTIDGRAAGIYGRLASRPLIDHRAQDVAVLVGPEENT